jgi:hypothetical protein
LIFTDGADIKTQNLIVHVRRCRRLKFKRQPDSVDEAALDKALPSLTEKLHELEGGLSEEERAVFSGIVNSAAVHLESMQAIAGDMEIRYSKPISAAATASVRDQMIELRPGARSHRLTA